MNTLVQKFLRSVLFGTTLACSALAMSTVLRAPTGKRVVGLFLLLFLLVTVVYAASWYLRMLWSLTGRCAKVVAARFGNPVQSTPALEQGR